MKITFNSRETYLEWRKEWKTEYKNVSELIRQTKNSIKNQHREKGRAEYEDWLTLFKSKRRATDLLMILVTAKVQAEMQYLANKKQQEMNSGTPQVDTPKSRMLDLLSFFKLR